MVLATYIWMLSGHSITELSIVPLIGCLTTENCRACASSMTGWWYHNNATEFGLLCTYRSVHRPNVENFTDDYGRKTNLAVHGNARRKGILQVPRSHVYGNVVKMGSVCDVWWGCQQMRFVATQVWFWWEWTRCKHRMYLFTWSQLHQQGVQNTAKLHFLHCITVTVTSNFV